MSIASDLLQKIGRASATKPPTHTLRTPLVFLGVVWVACAIYTRSSPSFMNQTVAEALAVAATIGIIAKRRQHIIQSGPAVALWSFHLGFWRYGIGMVMGAVMGGLTVLFLSDQFGVLRRDNTAGLAAEALFGLFTVVVVSTILWRVARGKSSNARGGTIVVAAIITISFVYRIVLPQSELWGTTHPRWVAFIALMLLNGFILGAFFTLRWYFRSNRDHQPANEYVATPAQVPAATAVTATVRPVTTVPAMPPRSPVVPPPAASYVPTRSDDNDWGTLGGVGRSV